MTKSEKGIAREKRKNGENVPQKYVHSRHVAELIFNTPIQKRNEMIEIQRNGASRRTFRRIMTYVRALEHKAQTRSLREKDVL